MDFEELTDKRFEAEVLRRTKKLYVEKADRLFEEVKAKAMALEDSLLGAEILQQVEANLSICNELLNRVKG